MKNIRKERQLKVLNVRETKEKKKKVMQALERNGSWKEIKNDRVKERERGEQRREK